MSDISTVQVDIEGARFSKDTLSFSKKNAWKNEWEKAQLDATKNEKQKVLADVKNSVTADQNNSKGLKVSNDMSIEKGGHVMSGGDSLQAENRSSHNLIKSDFYVSALSGVNNSNNLAGTQIAETMQSMINGYKSGPANSIGKIDYAQGVINKAETKFGALFKPQNLNILMVENGVKVYLRDYRLDTNQLNKIIEEVTKYLQEFGLNVNEVMVNGVAYENS